MSNHEHLQQRNLEQLGYERSRQSEIQHHHRSASAGRSKQPVFQIRATNFVKKIGFLTSKLGAGARLKSYQNTSDDTKLHVAGGRQSLRKARSMDILRSKPYVPSPVLNVTSFDSNAFPRKSLDGSHESGSTNGIELDGLKSTHSRKVSESNSIAHGLAVAAIVADAASLRPSPASSTTPESSDKPRSPKINDIEGLGCMKSNSNGQNRSRGRSESLAPRPSDKRPAHPRLSTLPPLTFHLKGVSQDQRPQRFSPSVIVRPPPFPVLELPALPTPIAETSASGGQAQAHPRRAEARLNSMPLLPREGSDSRENDPDHEGCVLDEDECDDEDNEEDGATGEGDAAGSEDEDEAVAGVNGGRIPSSSNAPPSPTSSFFSQNRSLPPLLTLPAINTPSLSTLLGSFSNPSNGSQSQRVDSGSGSLSAIPRHVDATPGSVLAESMKQSRDEETTPKAAQASFTWNRMSIGSAQADYFSTSGALSKESTDRTESASESQFIHNHKTAHSSEFLPPLSIPSTVSSSSTSAVQTPTDRNQPASQTPMISVVPPHSPWSRTETGTPFPETRLYKDSSFTSAKGAEAQVPHYTPTNVADGLPKRPSIYHHASKSMIELFSITSLQTKGTADADEDAPKFGIDVSDRDRKGKGKLLPDEPGSNSHPIKTEERLDCGNITLLHPRRDRNTRAGEDKALPSTPTAPISGDAAVPPTLRRQRSMPTFSSSGPPPPYPSFLLPEHLRRFAPVPREDEGTEELPPYSNDIRLTAVIPRKMEFTAPGVPARDRKWRRVHCVLEGTAFRVYDAPPRVTGVSAFGGWWERKMGVGDVSSGQCAGVGATAGPGATTNIVIGRKDPKRRMKWEEELQAEEDARRASESATEEGLGRASISSSTTTVEVNVGVEHDRPQKSRRNLAATLLHPNRSRYSLTHDRSPSPASPRSSFQSAPNPAESSSPPSARPSVDLSGISASSSSSTALSSDAGGSTSASSGSVSGLSTNSGTSSVTQPRWRGHLRSDSAHSSLSSHSRSNSRAQTPLIQESLLQASLRRQSSRNSYLYHDPGSIDLPEPDERDLLRIYSLQNAESGLASDYMKRKNVVRVRMEGEQFLLQCKDVASVVEWIEGFQAASNIALDLDERPMPKGPIFPRRRRRRRVQRTESGTEQPAEATSRLEPAAGADTTTGTAS